MGLMYELKENYKTLSIVGMAKNSGKTTALNYFIEEAMDEGIALGITSTGRDGETRDLVTGTDKPRVYLYEGTIVSVPTKLYDLADAGLEILRMTNYHTSIGQLLLCRVVQSGYVQIAGPVTTADSKKMCMEMLELGSKLILIDGAIDRKSIAAPDTSDAIILATGAVLSRSIKKVVDETAHIVNLYRLPRLKDEKLRGLLESKAYEDKLCIIKNGEVKTLELKTGLAASRYIDEAIDDETDGIYIPGALTNSVIADIHPKKLARVKLILKDPTKIFIDNVAWAQLKKKGVKTEVMENIRVAAITVNPYSPQGYTFSHEELRDAMAEAVPEIPVMDVRL